MTSCRWQYVILVLQTSVVVLGCRAGARVTDYLLTGMIVDQADRGDGAARGIERIVLPHGRCRSEMSTNAWHGWRTPCLDANGALSEAPAAEVDDGNRAAGRYFSSQRPQKESTGARRPRHYGLAHGRYPKPPEQDICNED